MTEADWHSADDPRPMLDFVRGRVPARRLRLFVAGCCRQAWSGAADHTIRAALDVVEHLAERGPLPTQTLRREVVRVPAGQAVLDCGASEPLTSFDVADGEQGLAPVALWHLRPPLGSILTGLACSAPSDWSPVWIDWSALMFAEVGLDLARQASLLREVVRGPFRALLLLAHWRRWEGGTVAHLAQAVHDARGPSSGLLDPVRLAILADALEDAGCTEEDLLEHLRSPGPHVSGCWVVDALRGIV